MTKPIALVVTGRTFPSISAGLGDFEDWIARGLGDMPLLPVHVCDGAAMPDPAGLSGVVISGSHEMVTDRLAWSEALADWLRRAVPAGLPVLGICYGHQLLAQALGGVAGPREQGMEFGTVDVSLAPEAATDPLLAGLPARFPAHVIHMQSALTLPPGALRLGASPADPHQILRFAPRCWGVQFHPEFNEAVVAGYARELDAPPLQSASGRNQTPESHSLLQRFAALCRAGEDRVTNGRIGGEPARGEQVNS